MEIELEMSRRMDEWEKQGLKLGPRDGGDGLEKQASADDFASQYEGANRIDSGKRDDVDANHSSGDEESEAVEDGMILRIGVFCHMGRHISVAMV